MSRLSQPAELTWGALTFASAVSPDLPYRIEAVAAGSTFGSPMPLVEYIRLLAADGSMAVRTGHDNREIKIRVRVSAHEGASLASAEAAIRGECDADQLSPLIWTSPVIDAQPAAFDIVHATLADGWDADWDVDEMFRAHRYYEITWQAWPWARDLETTTIPAIPAPVDPETPATVTVLNTCDSLTGWSNFMHPAGAWSDTVQTAPGDYLRLQSRLAKSTGAATMSQILTAPVTMGAETYLIVDAAPATASNGDPLDLQVRYDTGSGVVGAPGTDGLYYPVAIMATATPNVSRYYFEAPASFSAIRFLRYIADRSRVWGTLNFQIYQVAKTDRIEISGTNGLQVARTAVVGGSAPTQAAITLDASPSPLVGSTALIYTGRSAVVSLRALCTASASPTIDDTKISGAYNDLSTTMKFVIPATALQESTYSLMGRLSSTGAQVINWSARLVSVAGATIPGSEVVKSGQTLVRNTTADPWMIHSLANIQLPTIRRVRQNHAIEITLSMTTGGSGVLVDEGWLADTGDDRGAVTVVHEPSAFQLTRIDLLSPQVDAPLQAVVGTWETYGEQDIGRLVTSFGTHALRPGLLHVFTATDMARFAECSLTYYRRHHTNPAPDLTEVG